MCFEESIDGRGQKFEASTQAKTDAHTAVYHRITKLLGNYVDSMQDRSNKVVEFATPTEILSIFSSVCGSSEEDGGGATPDEIVRLTELVLAYSVRTSSPLFFNQLYGRVDPIALAAENVIATLNTNAFTWEVAPVFTTLERSLVKRLARVFGMPCDSEGMFVPGGSMANIYGMHSARAAKLGTGVKKAGMIASAQGKELVGFCSADSHYSYAKGASLMGLGSDNMVPIPVDHSPAGRGGMRLDLLESAIQQAVAKGKVPFMVGATVGTTVYGGFDDIRGLREVCDRHQLWLHADGAWGGAVVFGAAGGKAKLLSDGLGLADSVSWNPHKMMGAPLQCSVFLTRMVSEAGLRDINGCGASYCFQVDKNFPEEDMGDMTLLCSRRADSFKLWLLWRAVGDKGMADRVDTAVSLSQRFSEMIRDRAWLDVKGVKGRFVLWRDQDPFFCNICFYYLPPSMSDVEDGLAIWELPADDVVAKRVCRVAPFIKNDLQRQGTGGMMGFCGAHNHFRLVFASPIGLTYLDLESLVLAIDLVGATYQESPAAN